MEKEQAEVENERVIEIKKQHHRKKSDSCSAMFSSCTGKCDAL